MKKLTTLFTTLILSQMIFATGVLIVDAGNGTYLQLVSSVVKVDVNNQVALVTSTHKFVNQTGANVKVKYGFPMPDNGTATQLKWQTNNVWYYAEFSASERDTTLPGTSPASPTVDVDLVNYLGSTPLFFNINDSLYPNDSIEFEITYVQLLHYEYDIVSFDYQHDYTALQPNSVPFPQEIQFNLYSDRTITSINIDNYPALITNNGNLGTVDYSSTTDSTLNLFHIEYQLASDELGLISLTAYIPDSVAHNCDSLGNGFLGLIIEPESNDQIDIIEKVFTLVIDESGSMSGTKIVQAKEAATFIINNLNVGDYFNIVRFNGSVTSFKTQHVPFSAANQIDALNFIANIYAGGGTNILLSLTTAIDQFAGGSPDKANIIIFCTDGMGMNSTPTILNAVESSIAAVGNPVYIFTFGIGNNVNEQLLTLLATENMGLAEFIGDQDVSTLISSFYLTIQNPVLLNTQISFSPNVIAEIYPSPLPNLYKGMQLILSGRYSVPQDVVVTLSGNAFNSAISYSYNISLSDSLSENLSFLPKLWAKSKMEYLSYLFYTLPQSSEEADSIKLLVEEISLCYEVISNFTSFSNNVWGTNTSGGLNVTNTGGFGSVDIEEIEKDKPEFNHGFYPNPFTNQTSLVIELKETLTITTCIYSIDGKLIKTIKMQGSFGQNTILWDGLDMDSEVVKKGIYIYKITAGDQSFYGKVVKQ